MTYNINTARAQRKEASGVQDWPFEFDGRTWHLATEVPLDLVGRIEELEATPGAAGIRAIVEILLGDEAPDFPWSKLTIQDIIALFEAYQAEAPISLGESETSPSSLNRTARRSKPTSKPTTASTSRTSTAAKSRGGASKR